MLKSTAGGGGIGMRLCNSAAELRDAFEAVSRQSQASFGSSGLYLERFVTEARHIEVQIFGDGNGSVIALGERDCSVQRRNQKVIEETPAPGLSPAVRQKLLESAVRLGRAVRYQSAGTVEFIYDNSTGDFYFLEVNTRLQVEHGVTEEVTGVDLVEWMVQTGCRRNVRARSNRDSTIGIFHSGARLRRRSSEGFSAERRAAHARDLADARARGNVGRFRNRGHAVLRSDARQGDRAGARIAPKRWRICAPLYVHVNFRGLRRICLICSKSARIQSSKPAASLLRSCETSHIAAAPST